MFACPRRVKLREWAGRPLKIKPTLTLRPPPLHFHFLAPLPSLLIRFFPFNIFCSPLTSSPHSSNYPLFEILPSSYPHFPSPPNFHPLQFPTSLPLLTTASLWPTLLTTPTPLLLLPSLLPPRTHPCPLPPLPSSPVHAPNLGPCCFQLLPCSITVVLWSVHPSGRSSLATCDMNLSTVINMMMLENIRFIQYIQWKHVHVNVWLTVCWSVLRHKIFNIQLRRAYWPYPNYI